MHKVIKIFSQRHTSIFSYLGQGAQHEQGKDKVVVTRIKKDGSHIVDHSVEYKGNNPGVLT